MTLSFLGLFFLFPPVMFILWQYTSGYSLFTVSIPTISFWILFVFGYIGHFVLFFFLDQYRFISGVQDQNLIFQMFLISSWSIFGFYLATMFSSYISFSKIIGYSLKPLKEIKTPTIYLFLLFIISVTTLIIYLYLVPEIALYTLFEKGVTASQVARSNMGNNFPGKYHWYRFFMRDVINVVTISFFASYLATKKNLYLGIISLMAAVLSAVMATEKAPIVWLIISLYLAYAIVRQNRRIFTKKGIFVGVFIISILSVAYILFMDVGQISQSLYSIASRVFTGQIHPFYYYLEYFPAMDPFLWGESFPNPGRLFPYEPYPLTTTLYAWKNAESVSQGIVGSMPTLFWGEAYANFGIGGVFTAPLIIGFIFGLIEKISGVFLKGGYGIGFYIWFIIFCKNELSSGFFYLFVSPEFGIMWFFWGIPVLGPKIIELIKNSYQRNPKQESI